MNGDFRWKIPPRVKTPDIDDDIRSLLSEDILKKYRTYRGKDDNETEWTKKKICRIVEMLDLCNHLDHFKQFLSTKNIPKIEGEWLRDNINFEGHDYSGCPYDIEALMLYLYVSIIDACACKSSYKPIEKFLNNKINEADLKKEGKSYVLKLCEKYSQEYGLSKNFKNVFNNLSEKLKKEFADNILVLNGERTSDYSMKDIDDLYCKWLQKDINERIKKIATVIYSVRSKYSHENIRAFIPSRLWNPDGDNKSENADLDLKKINVENISKEETIKCAYISTIQTDILLLLKKVIKECCAKMLSDKV